jgi:hypothetical protein
MGNRRIRFTHARSQLVGTVGTARTSPDSVSWLRGRGQPGSLHGIVSRRRDDFNLLNTHTHTLPVHAPRECDRIIYRKNQGSNELRMP